VTTNRQLQALGDPTRAAIFEILRDGPRAVGEIAKRLPVSRPAVSQHLRALREAGLVTLRTEGTRNLYRIDLRGLAELRAYMDGFWELALESFKAVAETEKKDQPEGRTAWTRSRRSPRSDERSR
jgi:DNA-binding transcriptional ArsR family regulator